MCQLNLIGLPAFFSRRALIQSDALPLWAHVGGRSRAKHQIKAVLPLEKYKQKQTEPKMIVYNLTFLLTLMVTVFATTSVLLLKALAGAIDDNENRKTHCQQNHCPKETVVTENELPKFKNKKRTAEIGVQTTTPLKKPKFSKTVSFRPAVKPFQGRRWSLEKFETERKRIEKNEFKICQAAKNARIRSRNASLELKAQNLRSQGVCGVQPKDIRRIVHNSNFTVEDLRFA